MLTTFFLQKRGILTPNCYYLFIVTTMQTSSPASRSELPVLSTTSRVTKNMIPDPSTKQSTITHPNIAIHQCSTSIQTSSYRQPLNSGKTELILFRHPNKQLNYDLKIKINGKKLEPSKQVKYLGVVLDPHLNWSYHIDGLATKLSRATGMLAKIRHFVPVNTLRSIYFGIFSSLLTYGSQVWGQFQNQHVGRLQKIQNKAIRIINFSGYNDPVDPIYHKLKVLKLGDHVKLQNFLYVHNSLNNKVPMNYVHKMVGVSLGRSGIYIDRKTPSPQLKGLS